MVKDLRSTDISNTVANADGSATGDPLRSGMVAFAVASTEVEETVCVLNTVTFATWARTRDWYSKPADPKDESFMMPKRLVKTQWTSSLHLENEEIYTTYLSFNISPTVHVYFVDNKAPKCHLTSRQKREFLALYEYTASEQTGKPLQGRETGSQIGIP